jgi:hypothetical protein
VTNTREAELMSVAATFATPLEAELARLVLSEQDIASRLEGDLISGAALPLQGTRSVRLLVAEQHAERAHALIGEHERALAAERPLTDTADQRVGRAYRLALVGLLLVPVVTQLISLVQLLRVSWSALSRKGRRQYLFALSLDALVLGSVAYWVACELEDAPNATDVRLPIPSLPD